MNKNSLENAHYFRIWMTSGTGIIGSSTSPVFSQLISSTFLSILGITETDLDVVHDLLVQMPLEQIMNASAPLLDIFGTSFVPVVESAFPGVTRIIEDDPKNLTVQGYGSNITLVIGFANTDCAAFAPKPAQLNITQRYIDNLLAILPPTYIFSLPSNVSVPLAQQLGQRYFGSDPPTFDGFLQSCTDAYAAYPEFKLAKLRVEYGGAPVYIYKYSYQAEYNIFATAFNLTYTGAGFGDDYASIFKVNSFPVPYSARDRDMSVWMTNLFVNFAKTK
jgi:hypothetical protein